MAPAPRSSRRTPAADRRWAPDLVVIGVVIGALGRCGARTPIWAGVSIRWLPTWAGASTLWLPTSGTSTSACRGLKGVSTDGTTGRRPRCVLPIPPIDRLRWATPWSSSGFPCTEAASEPCSRTALLITVFARRSCCGAGVSITSTGSPSRTTTEGRLRYRGPGRRRKSTAPPAPSSRLRRPTGQ